MENREEWQNEGDSMYAADEINVEVRFDKELL